MSAPPQPSPDETLRLLYEENGRVAAAFWDWRHKVILLCAAMMTVVLSIASWLYKEKLGGIAIGVPFLFGAAGAYVCRRFDRRNGEIIDRCFAIGTAIESRLRLPAPALALDPKEAGIYTALLDSRTSATKYDQPRKTYSWTLRRAYGLVSVVFFAAAVGAFVVGAVHPSTLVPHTA